jgi:hypothetical protein
MTKLEEAVELLREGKRVICGDYHEKRAMDQARWNKRATDLLAIIEQPMTGGQDASDDILPTLYSEDDHGLVFGKDICMDIRKLAAAVRQLQKGQDMMYEQLRGAGVLLLEVSKVLCG